MRKKTTPLFLAAAMLSFAGVLPAATLYWDGSSSTVNGASDNTSTGDMNWLNGGNWDNGSSSVAKSTWVTGDSAVFGGNFTGVQKVTLDSSITFNPDANTGTTFVRVGDSGSQYFISLTGTSFNRLQYAYLEVNAGSTISADGTSNNAHNVGGVTLNGGTLTSANGGTTAANDGTWGNWVIRSLTTGGTSRSTINSATLAFASGTNQGQINVGDAVSGTDLLITAAITSKNTPALVKSGAGTLELTGNNSGFAQGLSINSGAVLAGHASALGAGSVTLAGGSLLSGVSTLSGVGILSMTSGALTLNGASAGTLTLAANKNLSFTGGRWNVDLANGADLIAGSGTGTFTINGLVLDLGSGAIDYAQSYSLIGGFASGSVSNLSITGYDSANYLASLGTNGRLTFTAVPEPSAYGLLGAGALAAGAFVRRRKNRR